MRSTTGLAAVIALGDDGLPAALRHRLAAPAAAVAVVVELVLDKMALTGSRLEASGMVGRLGFSGMAAGLVARRSARPLIPAVLVAVGAAAATAKIAHDVRARLAKTMPDRAVAVAEDLVALTLVSAGYRLTIT